jgi:hypothetical protein
VNGKNWIMRGRKEEEEKRRKGENREEKKRKKGKMRRGRSGWLDLVFWMLEWEMMGVEQ